MTDHSFFVHPAGAFAIFPLTLPYGALDAGVKPDTVLFTVLP